MLLKAVLVIATPGTVLLIFKLQLNPLITIYNNIFYIIIIGNNIIYSYMVVK